MRYATIFSLVSLVVLAITIPIVHAETYQVSINEGSFDRNCVPNCMTPQVLTINLGDTVTWTNLETDSTKNHGFVSGNPIEGLTGEFDSGTIRPGDSWSMTFNSEGQFDYFDMAKPWIQGSVIVGTITVEREVEVVKEFEKEIEVITANGTSTKTITETIVETEIELVEIEPDFEQRPEAPLVYDTLLEEQYPDRISDIKEFINVGLDIDADNVFTVNYIFHEKIANSRINADGDGNALEFMFREPVTGNLVLKMPNGLIGETLVVIQEDATILPHTWTQHGDYSIVEIQINEPARILTIGATYVTPEYLDIAILGAIIGAIIGISVYIKYKQPKLTILN